MLKVQIHLNERDEGRFSPTIMVTEDSSTDSCPIIFPEDLPKEHAEFMTSKTKEYILENFKTVAELSEKIYGK
jgi:hypothetical protein